MTIPQKMAVLTESERQAGYVIADASECTVRHAYVFAERLIYAVEQAKLCPNCGYFMSKIGDVVRAGSK